MYFADLYVGAPPGQSFPDLTEILDLNSRLDNPDIDLESSIGLDLESSLESEIILNVRTYT